jgi:DNA invertase Pin-like site-specific DNA recombinase
MSLFFQLVSEVTTQYYINVLCCMLRKCHSHSRWGSCRGSSLLLSHVREADTLVVWKLDRLGRSVKGLVDLVNELEAQKVHFQSITEGVDTKTPAGRFFFHVMASLAQMERELILERTRAGLESARCAGRVGGRKRRMTDSKVKAARKLLASGTTPHEVAHSLGVSVPTLYRWVPASSRT